MAETYTPMMQQYLKVKEQYPDTLVFYRIGDFYEMFFDDAKTASRELDLVLTGKNAGVTDKVPMCGVPHHAVSGYLQRLVNRGYKVAIVEQTQDPKEAVGLVQRDVIRVITPGTITDEITDEKSSVYLASLIDSGYGYSLAIAEASTGENFVLDIAHKETLLYQAIMKNNVREVVMHENFSDRVIKRLRQLQVVISYCEAEDIKEEYLPLAEKLTRESDRQAYGMMLNYLEATQKHMLAHLSVVQIEQPEDVLSMDYATQQNLELIVPLHTQGSNETLWTFLDCCKSAMGSRLLKKWIEKPLVKEESVLRRQDQVDYLMKEFMKRQAMRDGLGSIYDLQRLIARCAMNNANAIDCQRLSKTLEAVPIILAQIEDPVFSEYSNTDPLAELRDQLKDAFVENPPVYITDGGMFKDGYNKELDEARSIQNSGREWIASMESKEREKTGIKTLKIGYNRVFGYYIEISKAAAAQVQDEWGYVRKQTLTNCERFVSQDLKEKENAILHAQEHASAIEKQLFAELLEKIRKHLSQLQKLSTVLAELDVLSALAETSSRYGYIRPEFSEDELDIENGRHPILDERMKDQKYVANSLKMDKNTSILIITGPNMGGKSTYMRQAALIVIMAQMGCFVPAKKCTMPLFDQIFTRIGASDDILSGQSTFMVEMNDANRALSEATSRSLILFDEIGRGTSTYDGMALAQAMIEYIASCIHAKTLFSTHYHELTSLEESIDCVRNIHVAVKEEQDKVTFLYKIKEGRADRSYGINVARLAGLPESVLDRAKDLQKQLESKRRVVQQSYQLVEMEKKDPVMDQIGDTLRSVNSDDLSPRQAWELINDLSAQAKKKE